jgi:TM2 domain-containing membrane protein YozV
MTKSKSIVRAYVLLLCGGIFGAHKFYLGKPFVGSAYFVAGLAGTFAAAIMHSAFFTPTHHGMLWGLVLLAVVALHPLIGMCALAFGCSLLWDVLTLPTQVRDAACGSESAPLGLFGLHGFRQDPGADAEQPQAEDPHPDIEFDRAPRRVPALAVVDAGKDLARQQPQCQHDVYEKVHPKPIHGARSRKRILLG